MRLTGHVHCGIDPSPEGIPGVAVSDGNAVVLTDADGRYVIDAEEAAEFLYLSLPAGYRIPRDAQNRAQFFQPVTTAQAMDFQLERVDTPTVFDFVYVTDMHLDNNREDRFRTETIGKILTLPTPGFVLCGGDISIQGGAQERFLSDLSLLRSPCFHCIGNHEVMVGQPDPKAAYKQLFGPTYYSFNYGRFHFVVLDGTRPEPTRQGWKNVVGEVDGRQLRWLCQDLALIEPGRPVIICTHIPLVSTYSERRGLESATAEPAWEIQNAAEVMRLLAGHRVLCVLQGHMHENEHLYMNGMHFLTSGAAAGKWWRGDNPDGSPGGFRVVRIAGEDVESEYQCTGLNRDGGAASVMTVSVSEPEAWMGRPVRVDVNVFDGMPGRERVFARAGQREWWELSPVPGVLHRWTGYVPVGEVDAESVLTVEVRRGERILAQADTKLTFAPWSPGH